MSVFIDPDQPAHAQETKQEHPNEDWQRADTVPPDSLQNRDVQLRDANVFFNTSHKLLSTTCSIGDRILLQHAMDFLGSLLWLGAFDSSSVCRT